MPKDRTIKNNVFIASGEFMAWCLFAVMVGVVVALLPEASVAAGPTDNISSALCSLTSRLNGTMGKAMASIAVAAAGIMALYGRAAWGTVFLVGGGVLLIFYATTLVNGINIGTGMGVAACGPDTTPQFHCNGATPSGNLFDIDTIAAQQGSLTANPTENTCVEVNNQEVGNCGIFSRALWMFNQTVGSVMGSMYCSFSNTLKGPIAALLTVFVMIYGITVLAGMTQFNLKDAGIMVFKFALVWAFATQAEWGVDVGYNFFINFAEQGSAMMIAAMPPAAGGQPVSLTSPDTIFESILGQSTGTQSTVSDIPLTCTIFLTLLGLFLLMFMPILIIFLVLIIINYLGNFARAMLGYLTALVLISFLFVLAPFFLAFALFRTTLPLFEAWIKHLIAFSLQMVIMFGFMALLAMIPFAAFFKEMLALLHSYSQVFDFGPGGPFVISFPLSFCGICQYNIIASHMGAVNGVQTFMPASIACVPHPLNLTGLTVDQQSAVILNATKAAANLTWPPGPTGQKGFMLSEDHNYYVMSILNLIQHSDFVKFVVIQALSLYFISRVAGEFMKKAPDLAASIGQLPIAAALGGGASPSGIKINFIGLDSVQAAGLGLKNALMGLHINPLKDPKGFIKRLNPANAAKAWGTALKDVIGVGKDGIERDQFGVGKGIIGGFLYGAHDGGSDINYKKLKFKRAQKELKAAQDRVNELIANGKTNPDNAGDMRALKRAMKVVQQKDRWKRKMELDMRGNLKAGILGIKGLRGTSSLNMLNALSPAGDESKKMIDDSRAKDIRAMRGEDIRTPGEWYGFIKQPQGLVSIATSKLNLQFTQGQVQSMAGQMQQRLGALFKDGQLSEAQKADYDRQIRGLVASAGSATTEAEAEKYLSQLCNLNLQF